MADKPASEKTEKPTQRRLKEAREKGQVAKTPELTVWMGILATTFVLQFTVQRSAVVLHDTLEKMGTLIAHPDPDTATRFASESAMKAAAAVAPMLLTMMAVTFVVAVAQVGFKPTSKKLKPDFSRLNPAKGFKKMVAPAAWWELGKSVAKTALLAAIALPAMSAAIGTLTGGLDGSLFGIATYTGQAALSVLRNMALLGLGIAAADYAYQKMRVTKQLRMTRQELREELKTQEGNPEMRRALRGRAMAISRNRMIGMVSAADVVIVNPTHYAVALKYDSVKGAPEMVAKGAGVLAAAIRREAEEHGVAIVQEPVLTRALYRSCAIGQLIPVEMYEAVAHLLAFVFGLRSKGRAAGTHELPRPALL